MRWLLGLVALALLVLLGWVVAGGQTVRRSRLMIAALNDSTRGRCVIERGPNFNGFAAHIQPAPEPFLQFTITWQAAAKLDLLGWLLRIVTRRRDQLVFRAKMVERPQAELVWARGRIPARALGRSPSVNLWVSHWLDIINSEYVTRGVNPAALIHVFIDMQTRFEPLLEQVNIQAEEIPEVEIILRGGGLNPDEIPALVTTIRAAGRAALVR